MKRAEIELLLPEIIRRTLPPSAKQVGDAPIPPPGSQVLDAAVPQDANPLPLLLDVMELLHAPDEAVLLDIDRYFDPHRAPDAFVAYLAGWVDLDDLWIANPQEFTAETLPPFPGGIGRLRELVAASAYLSRWRGTARGLLRFLELATGVTGFTIDEQVLDADDEPIPFHIRVRVPQAAVQFRTLIERIVVKEKPAYVTFELAVEA